MTTYIVFRQHSKQMSHSSSDFDNQLERLLEKQKIARINNQHFTSVTILKEIITLCYNSREWSKLNEQITFLMNRRGQSKKAQIQMIQLAMSWLPKTQQPQCTKLIEAIRDVCAKKIFLEVEYARCILMIVKNKEDGNDILEAANILQEVQVETYGSMDKREKLQFILYQMKIMLKKKDYVRFYIISKKINQNNINEDDIADLKVSYYSYMTIYYNNEKIYDQCCRCYRIIWETLKKTKKIIPEALDFDFSASIRHVLSNYIGFLCLQPHSSVNHKQLQSLSERQDLQKYPQFLFIINKFLSEEIVSCNVQDYQPDSFQLFRDSFVNSKPHLQELKRMLVQHNVRIISKYYGQLSLTRVSELLKVQKEYCEEEICTLNNKRVISCRIDRIDGIIDFKPIQNEQYLLKNWNESINGILDLVDVTTNLIHREREVYKK